MDNINYNEMLGEIQVNSYDDILNKLPSDLDESAIKFNVITRFRTLKSARNLLLAIFYYALTDVSFNRLALLFAPFTLMSDTSWRKKFRKANSWLAELLNQTLAIVPKVSIPSVFSSISIFLLDASCITQTGENGMYYRVHALYDLVKGKMHEIKLTDKYSGESFSYFNLIKGALYIADSGYGRVTQIMEVLSASANFIFRITPSNINLYNESGEKIFVADIIKNTSEKELETDCFVKSKGELVKLRLILNRIPKEKEDAALKRKKRESKSSKMLPETLEYAKWVILLTSLDSNYTKKQILSLYFSRWQVELLFKRIKQHLKIRKIRKGSESYATTLIYAWLIIWAVVESGSYMLEALVLKKQEENSMVEFEISKWDVDSVNYSMFDLAIKATIAAKLKGLSYGVYMRFLSKRKRKRGNQYLLYKMFIQKSSSAA